MLYKDFYFLTKQLNGKMISALLNKKIIIEKGESEFSSVLSPTLKYIFYKEAYANVYVRTANAVFGDSEEYEYYTEFTVRYNSFTKDLNNKYRILYNGNYYKIKEVIEVENKHTIKIIASRYGD